MKKQLASILLLATLLLSLSLPAQAADIAEGAKIFDVHCVGCHVNGGNIVRRGKTLKQKALKRNGVDSLEAIASLVSNGKSNMPAYKQRLSDPQIQAVSAYVLEQAAKNWH